MQTCKTICLLILASFLGACAAPSAETESVATHVSQPPVENPAPVMPEPVEDRIPEAVEPEPEPVIESPDPDDLLGLEPKVIQELLGPVSLKRWEGAVQVMQFANEHCVMDIYFYEEAPGAAFEASYINARLKDGAEISSDVCLAALLPNGQWPERFGEAIPAGQ